MFRLVNDAFKENKELHDLAVHCITETIKYHLEYYFEADYQNEKDDALYRKVRLERVYELFSEDFMKNMADSGVNVSVFIPKKIAQFMLLLKSKEEKTPDLFIEYILDRMIDKQIGRGYDFLYFEKTGEEISRLKKLLRIYAKEVLEIEDVKERNKYVRDHVILLTRFTCLLGVEEPDDDSLAFWDWDFSFFDDWGFKKTLEEFAYGTVGFYRSYGPEYIKSIFTDIGENVPSILNRSGIWCAN